MHKSIGHQHHLRSRCSRGGHVRTLPIPRHRYSYPIRPLISSSSPAISTCIPTAETRDPATALSRHLCPTSPTMRIPLFILTFLFTFFSLATTPVSADSGVLYTDAVTYCAEAKAVIVDEFDITYHRSNGSVTFSFSLASVEPNLNTSVNLYINAYGIQIINQTLELCDLLQGVICPLPQVNFTGMSQICLFFPGINNGLTQKQVMVLIPFPRNIFRKFHLSPILFPTLRLMPVSSSFAWRTMKSPLAYKRHWPTARPRTKKELYGRRPYSHL